MKPTVISMFSGIGGLDLGFERAGFEIVRQCEIDPFCRRVLTKHWPDVPCHDDVKTMTFTEGEADGIIGGFPCQDISNAGRRAGITGERSGLYGELVRAICVVRPRFAVLENVAALLERGLGTVLGDLAEVWYDAEWDCVSAGSIGAPHFRERIFILAHRCGEGIPRSFTRGSAGETGSWGWRGEADLCAIAAAPFDETDRWPQPLVRRVDDGVSAFVDRRERIKGCGNAVVPQVAEVVANMVSDSLGLEVRK